MHEITDQKSEKLKVVIFLTNFILILEHSQCLWQLYFGYSSYRKIGSFDPSPRPVWMQTTLEP